MEDDARGTDDDVSRECDWIFFCALFFRVSTRVSFCVLLDIVVIIIILFFVFFFGLFFVGLSFCKGVLREEFCGSFFRNVAPARKVPCE